MELLRNVRQSGRNTEVGSGDVHAVAGVDSGASWRRQCGLRGSWNCCATGKGRDWRVLGITWLVIMICMNWLCTRRPYYPAPAYPMLFAAGGVAFERWFAANGCGRWLRPAYIAVLVILGVLNAPLAYFPMLSVNQYIAYSRFMHFGPPRIEKRAIGTHCRKSMRISLGGRKWRKWWRTRITKLPEEERKSCAIFGQNYGQAGAIDFFGAKMGLPLAISGHQNYFYWGHTRVYGRVHDSDGGSAGTIA